MHKTGGKFDWRFTGWNPPTNNYRLLEKNVFFCFFFLGEETSVSSERNKGRIMITTVESSGR